MRIQSHLAALFLACCAALASSCIIEVTPAPCGSSFCGSDECCIESCAGSESFDSCVDPSMPCPAIYAPVCGCDGTTYGNSCEAHGACVAVAHQGACEVTCGGATCSSGECCIEGCGGVDVGAACVAPTFACDEVHDLVCGCDGVTHGNSCEAHAACVAIAHFGACDSICAYEDPGVDGCPEGTIECPIGGPALRCVPPAQAGDCCCELCA